MKQHSSIGVCTFVWCFGAIKIAKQVIVDPTLVHAFSYRSILTLGGMQTKKF